MGLMHDVEPLLSATFALGYKAANTVVENLGARAGHGIHTCFFQGQQGFPWCNAADLTDVRYLWRPEGVELEAWELLLERAEEIGVIIEAKTGVVASLKEELFTAIAEGLFYLLSVGGEVRYIGFRMTGDAVEVAKLAIGHAHIGGVHVPVDDPGNLAMWYLDFAQLVGYIHQLGKRGILKEKDTFFSA
jgi:hypothetical protein